MEGNKGQGNRFKRFALLVKALRPLKERALGQMADRETVETVF